MFFNRLFWLLSNIPKKDTVGFKKSSLMYYNLSLIKHHYMEWESLFPFIKPYYAIKCNPDNKVIQTLAKLGCGMDCASKKEIQQVLDHTDLKESNLLFANPVKLPEDLLFAKENGVDWMTFDSSYELLKIATHHPQAKLILRIYRGGDKNAVVPFKQKLGAIEEEWGS